MNLKLRVLPLKDSEDISFANIVLYHDTCLDPIIKHRNILSGNYTLKCICGLAVELPAEGQAHQEIVRTAIRGEPGTVEKINRDIDSMTLLVG